MNGLGRGIVVFLGAAALLWAGASLAQPTPTPTPTATATPAPASSKDAAKCESGKLKEAGKYANCLLKAVSKAVKKGGTADVGKCLAKFSGKWTKLESKAAGACPGGEGDGPVTALYLADCLVCIAGSLHGERGVCGCGLEWCPA